jgi:hypothetical protein
LGLFYARAIVLIALLDAVAPRSGWTARLIALIDRYPMVPTQAMGFPADWRTRPIWT